MSTKERSYVRDARKGNTYWANNELIDDYAKKIGIYALGVYHALARFADNASGQCFPSQQTIAERLGISERTVRDALKKLQDNGLIDIKRESGEEGRFDRNVYTVLPIQRQDMPVPPAPGADGPAASQRQEVPPNNTLFNNTQEENNTKTAGAKAPGPSDEMKQALKGVWVYYIKKLNRDPQKYTATQARKEKGYLRLRECIAKCNGDVVKAQAMMCQAIEALASSEYHREHGHIDWSENLFKSAEKLEWWLDRKTGKAEVPKPPPAPVKSAADKVREQLAEEERRRRARAREQAQQG